MRQGHLLSALLPPGPVVGEHLGPLAANLDDLFPEERAVLAASGARRQAEFATSRRCARAALAALGRPPAAILAGERGAPTWPDGVIGSVTHTAGYCAAVVAPRGDYQGLGIDAEPAEPIPAALHARITTPPEVAHQQHLAATRPDLPWGRILFAGKEAIYKAWWPMMQLHLGFRSGGLGFAIEAETRESVTGSLIVTLYKPHLYRQFHGRWLVAHGLIIVAVVDPWPGQPPGGWDPRLEHPA